MDTREAAEAITEIIEDIYDKLGDIEMILDSAHVPEDIANRAKAYWLGHIDGALFNRGEIVGRSFVSAEDTIEELNNFAEENS